MSADSFRPRAFLLSVWGVNVVINAFYIAPAPVFSDMIEDLGISNAAAGGLISFYLLAILIFQIPAGYAIDRTDPRRIVVLSSLVLVGVGILLTSVPRYDALLPLRFLAGIPVAFIFVPSAFLVARAFSDAPGRAIGLFLSAPPTGVALGNLLGPLLAEALGWPIVFVAFSFPLLAVLPSFVRFAAPIPQRDHEAFTMRDYVAAFRSRELWKVGLAFACTYAAYIFYASWTPTYLRSSAIATAAVVGLISGAIPAAGILSRPLGGHLAETRFRADRRWVAGIAFLLLFLVGTSVPWSGPAGVPLLLAAGFLAQFPFSVYYLFASDIMPAKFGGTAFAFMNTISLIGGSISPGLAGLLVDLTGTFVASFLMIAATAVLGLATIAIVRER
jgi:NNP family nitrate/nitrite transporter-like MFS transporter